MFGDRVMQRCLYSWSDGHVRAVDLYRVNGKDRSEALLREGLTRDEFEHRGTSPRMMIDISPATTRMTSVLASLSEDQFDRPTPCPELRLGDLVDHVRTLTRAFTAVARKDSTGTSAPPRPSAANLEAGWRDRIARDLQTLADAWSDAAAWEGMTHVAGMDLPGEVAGLIPLDELVVHGWDIAVTTGQDYDPSAAEIEAALSFVSSFDAPRDGNLFGPVVPVADDAPPLDRLLGLTGRDPRWRPQAR